ncbi:MAG: hypothetical protein Q9204_004433, partial [Flavoplaca sp. TL-2023a]
DPQEARVGDPVMRPLAEFMSKPLEGIDKALPLIRTQTRDNVVMQTKRPQTNAHDTLERCP